MNATAKRHALGSAVLLASMLLIGLVMTGMPSSATAQDAGQYLRAFEARLNAGMAKGDFDYAVGLQAVDGIRVHPIAGVIKGREGLRDYFADLATRWRDMKETITWLVAKGNHAAAAITWEATNRKTGKRVKLPIALLADFNANGKIEWSEAYFNAGGPPPKPSK